MIKIKNIAVLPGVLLLAVACATAYRATPLPLGSFSSREKLNPRGSSDSSCRITTRARRLL